MKKTLLPSLVIIGLIYACTPSNTKKETSTTGQLSQSITYRFSDTVQLDSFKVELLGKDSETMQLLFTIKSFNGNEIYRQEIKASELLKNYLATADMKKESDKIKFLKEEIAFFFNERHFLEPAVTENEQPDKNVPDKAFYNELKQTGLNGFDYRLGKDDKIYIAWSVKNQKVKIYYKCC